MNIIDEKSSEIQLALQRLTLVAYRYQQAYETLATAIELSEESETMEKAKGIMELAKANAKRLADDANTA